MAKRTGKTKGRSQCSRSRCPKTWTPTLRLGKTDKSSGKRATPRSSSTFLMRLWLVRQAFKMLGQAEITSDSGNRSLWVPNLLLKVVNSRNLASIPAQGLALVAIIWKIMPSSKWRVSRGSSHKARIRLESVKISVKLRATWKMNLYSKILRDLQNIKILWICKLNKVFKQIQTKWTLRTYSLSKRAPKSLNQEVTLAKTMAPDTTLQYSRLTFSFIAAARQEMVIRAPTRSRTPSLDHLQLSQMPPGTPQLILSEVADDKILTIRTNSPVILKRL